MNIDIDALNGAVDYLASQLNGGTIRFYEGPMPASTATDVGTFKDLVELRFQAQAFAPAVGGRAEAYPMESAIVQQFGEVSWARLLTRTGRIVADLSVRAHDAPEGRSADIGIDRTTLHPGMKMTASMIVLRLPMSV